MFFSIFFLFAAVLLRHTPKSRRNPLIMIRFTKLKVIFHCHSVICMRGVLSVVLRPPWEPMTPNAVHNILCAAAVPATMLLIKIPEISIIWQCRMFTIPLIKNIHRTPLLRREDQYLKGKWKKNYFFH